jgi:hypothetical protein
MRINLHNKEKKNKGCIVEFKTLCKNPFLHTSEPAAAPIPLINKTTEHLHIVDGVETKTRHGKWAKTNEYLFL